MHLGEADTRIPEADAAGFQSVSALAVTAQPFHNSFGAAVADLKQESEP